MKRNSTPCSGSAVVCFIICLAFSPSYLLAQKSQEKFWEIGAFGGSAFITGDIPPTLGYGGGISARRTFNRLLSLRAGYWHSVNFGLDHRRRRVSRMAWDSPYDPWINYYEAGNQLFVANYKTSLHQFSADAITSFSLSKLFPRINPLSVYAYAGYSVFIADIAVDALDENLSTYDFSDRLHPIDFTQPRKKILPALRKHLNGDYESKWGIYTNGQFSHFSPKSRNPIRHAATVGAGAQYALSDRFSLQLDYRLSSAFTDYMDGVTTGSKSDINHLATMGVTYKFGGSKGIKKNTDVPGITTITAGPSILSTLVHVVDPEVLVRMKVEDEDTSYTFSFKFLAIVPAQVTPLHYAHLRLSHGEWMKLPVQRETKNMMPGKWFEYTADATKKQLQKLSVSLVSHLVLETSTMQLEDIVHPDKQKSIAKLARRLLK